jgi:CHASE3 domain sensor protein
MKRFAVGSLSNIGFGSAILVLLVVGIITTTNLRALIQSNEQVQHTLVVLGRLEETLALLTNAESSQRGYVITGNENYLGPYIAALAPENGASHHLQELRQLTSDNANQQKRLDTLEALVADKLALIQAKIRLPRDLRPRATLP